MRRCSYACASPAHCHRRSPVWDAGDGIGGSLSTDSTIPDVEFVALAGGKLNHRSGIPLVLPCAATDHAASERFRKGHVSPTLRRFAGLLHVWASTQAIYECSRQSAQSAQEAGYNPSKLFLHARHGHRVKTVAPVPAPVAISTSCTDATPHAPSSRSVHHRTETAGTAYPKDYQTASALTPPLSRTTPATEDATVCSR